MKLPKETSGHGRWYDDACGTAFALELIGERWSLLVVRELMLGARRFSDLRASLPGISAKVLTERLVSLEQAGVLNRRMLEPPGRAQVYELTDWGYAAEPMLQELGRWAAKSQAHDPTLPLSAASLMISLRTMFDPEKAAAMDARIGFEFRGDTYSASVRNSAVEVGRGGTDTSVAIFRAGDPTVIAALIYGNVPPEELERDAGLVIDGARGMAMRFAQIFELPEKLV